MKRLLLVLLVVLFPVASFASSSVFPWDDMQQNWSYRMVVACTDVVAVTSEILSTTEFIRSDILDIPLDAESFSISVRAGTSAICYATAMTGNIPSSVTFTIGVFPSKEMANSYITNITSTKFTPFPYKVSSGETGNTYIDVSGNQFGTYGNYIIPVDGMAAKALVVAVSHITAITDTESMRQIGNEGLTFEIQFHRRR